ncbi:MAG TPA: hypothetical protein VLA03_04070 [Draconibacterium sp.]|nr:hypothetical protein [Draconibacterium sp.]
MNNAFEKYPVYLFLFLTVFLFQSCKTDEFKFDELTLKEDFGIKIISPVFAGADKQGNHLEFRDFIHDWKKPVGDPSGPYTFLKYSNNTYKKIPTRLIYDSSSIIDSLQFLIQGEYILSEVELEFTVTNSCPLPLNLQLQFVKNKIPGPPILPPSFAEADFGQIPVNSITTVHNVKLDSMQMESFTDSKRLKISSWYNQTNFIKQNDTLSAHYPIDLSIVLIGTVQVKNE